MVEEREGQCGVTTALSLWCNFRTCQVFSARRKHFCCGPRGLGAFSSSLWSICPDLKFSEDSGSRAVVRHAFDLTQLLQELRTTASNHAMLQAVM